MSKRQRPIRLVELVGFFHQFEEKSLKRPFHRPFRLRSVTTVQLAQRLDGIVQELAARCVEEPSDVIAASCYLNHVSRAVAALDGMVLRRPDLWGPLARKSVQWPVLATLGPRITRSQEELLVSLELGRDAFLSMSKRSRTSTEEVATRYGISILQTVRDLHDVGLPCRWELRKLPSFSKHTWHSWWRVGKQIFLDAVPHPEEIEELRKLAHTKNSAAEKKALILERIGRAIKSLAPGGTPADPAS